MTPLNAQEKHGHRIGAAMVFRGKALGLQTRRGLCAIFRSEAQKHSFGNSLASMSIIAESETPLWTAHEDSETALIAGKIHNLRLAVRRLNGVEVPAGCVFSFWKQVRRTSHLKGYVPGRELREGCLIPTIGGGLCQLSNALYDAALRARFEIVERHAHTKVIPDSLAEMQRDATVFWNYVDLRFKSTRAFRVEAMLTTTSLVVRFRAEVVSRPRPFVLQTKSTSHAATPAAIESCFSCETLDCFRQVRVQTATFDFGRTAYLLDEYWPEFDRYVGTAKREVDLLCVPLNGKKFRRPNYAWDTGGFGAVKQSWLLTLWRSCQSRDLALQGASRQTALLAASDKLAKRYASLLSYDVAHIILMQHLLPFLWREGHLGGRTFDVLMTRLPFANLQQRLDDAFALHPESRTLADFRADQCLVEAEAAALRQARRIITPHPQIAALYPHKSVLIDWVLPTVNFNSTGTADQPRKLVFPAATLGRKGAYELREAIKGLPVQLTTIGPLLEGTEFWDGLQVEHKRADQDWLAGATAVVLPAFVEQKPRRLLEAVARGVPVIASIDCGLENVGGVTSVQAGDIKSLRLAIEDAVACHPSSTSPAKRSCLAGAAEGGN